MKEGEPVLGGDQAVPGGVQSPNSGTQPLDFDTNSPKDPTMLAISHNRPNIAPLEDATLSAPSISSAQPVNPAPATISTTPPSPTPQQSVSTSASSSIPPTQPIAQSVPQSNLINQTTQQSPIISSTAPQPTSISNNIQSGAGFQPTQAPISSGSNQPTFSSFQSGTQMPPADPFVQQFVSSAKEEAVGDVALGEAKRKKPIGKIIGIILSIVLVVGGVATYFIISAVNERDFKQNVEDLYSALDWAPYTQQCSMVVDNYNNTFIDAENFTGYIDDCKQNAETIEKLMAGLKGRSQSDEYIALYNNLATNISDTLVLGDDLNYSLNLYEIWHNWLLSTENIDVYQTEEEIDELVAPLIESGNEILSNYGTKWAELKKDAVAAYVVADAYSEEEYLDLYFTADDLLISYEYTNSPDITTLVYLNDNIDLSSLSSALNNFYNYTIGDTLQ